MRTRAFKVAATALVVSLVSGCHGLRQQLASLSTADTSSMEDCEIYAAIAKSELHSKNGVIELPAPDGLTCDWARHGLRFQPRERQPGEHFKQWLVFGLVSRSQDKKGAVVRVSYGYAPTFAREGTCRVKKKAARWQFAACHHFLVS
jgi:hypothetical protein